MTEHWQHLHLLTLARHQFLRAVPTWRLSCSHSLIDLPHASTILRQWISRVDKNKNYSREITLSIDTWNESGPVMNRLCTCPWTYDEGQSQCRLESLLWWDMGVSTKNLMSWKFPGLGWSQAARMRLMAFADFFTNPQLGTVTGDDSNPGDLLPPCEAGQ